MNFFYHKFAKTFVLAGLFVALCIGFANASTSSIVMDIETGKILSASNANEVRYPASMTKVMTLYLTFNALEKGQIKMDDKLIVSQKAWNVAPSKLGLKVGSKITVENAIKALIVKSANDCAVVLAESLGYDEQTFAKAMTDAGIELGMKNTTFKNPHGLPNKSHKSTAKDMAILAAATYSHFPQYYPLFSIKEFTYNGKTYKNHNELLKTFEGADGLKTGYTRAAGYNIMTSAMRDGKRVVAVTMGHKTLKERNSQMARMMETQLSKLIANSPKISPKKEIAVRIDTQKTIKETKDIEQSNSKWAVHIGSFSNYTKAKNYGNFIKDKNQASLANKNIEVEIVEENFAIVYKSKIIAFSKIDANNLCNNLKDSVKSCNVIKAKDIYLARKQ